jgi:hypothetical protein
MHIYIHRWQARQFQTCMDFPKAALSGRVRSACFRRSRGAQVLRVSSRSWIVADGRSTRRWECHHLGVPTKLRLLGEFYVDVKRLLKDTVCLKLGLSFCRGFTTGCLWLFGQFHESEWSACGNGRLVDMQNGHSAFKDVGFLSNFFPVLSLEMFWMAVSDVP